jgi:hypothetical protein
MTETVPPIANLTDEALQLLLKRAIRNTLILGMLISAVIMISTGWRNGAMFFTGSLISTASILEWQRIIRLINARIKRQKAPRGAALVIVFFLVRLLIFAAAIYGSLKCFQGSVVPLLFGLALAVLSLVWEVVRLLRD